MNRIGPPDTNRIARALRQPGIDSSHWNSLGIVQSVVVDPKQGPLCDVLLLPSEETVTARVATMYAGAGFGVWAEPKVDDEVLLSCPDADNGIGWIVIGRLWSPSDPVPAEAINAGPADLLIKVEDGHAMRILTTGGGAVLIDAKGGGDVTLAVDGGGKVKLSPATGTKGAARKDDPVSVNVPADWTTFASQVTIAVNGLVPGAVTLPTSAAYTGTITDASETVTAGD